MGVGEREVTVICQYAGVAWGGQPYKPDPVLGYVVTAGVCGEFVERLNIIRVVRGSGEVILLRSSAFIDIGSSLVFGFLII